MRNLVGNELKRSIKENLIYALDNRKAAATEIVFKFICSPAYKPKEIITIFGGIAFRDVDFGSITPAVIDIIVNNFHYDHFALIEKEFKPGKVECHGHGDFWATDKFIFTYYRLPEEEENEKNNKNI